MSETHRWHEMSYAEIGAEYAKVLAERDYWKQIAEEKAKEYPSD